MSAVPVIDLEDARPAIHEPVSLLLIPGADPTAERRSFDHPSYGASRRAALTVLPGSADPD